MQGATALVVVNPSSRNGDADLGAALALLREGGLEVVEVRPEGPEAIGDTVRRHRERVAIVIVAGGDGTLRAAAEALAECGRPLGILPLGTANDLARTLSIPSGLEDAARVILEGRAQAIDQGEVNGHRFFNVASIGLSVEVTRRLSGERKRRFGVIGYALSVRDAWRARRTFKAHIRCDGESRTVRSIQIAVGSGRHHGGGLTVAEDAAIDDGRLDLYSLPPLGFLPLLARLPALWLGRQRRWPDGLAMRGREIEITTDRAMPINADGELVTRTPGRFRVLPKAVSVLVPPDLVPASEDRHVA